MPSDTLNLSVLSEASKALCPDGPPRVWSLIVTVFGDTGGEIEIGAAPLARMLATAGISGPAMRVALHRLKSDGWITARRIGRSSAYRLHPDRQTEIRDASARIYAKKSPPSADAWHILALPPDTVGTEQALSNAIAIAPRLLLKAGAPQNAVGALALGPTGQVPSWLRSAVGTAELRKTYDALHHGLARTEDLTRSANLQPVEEIALRILIVHAWRRVILRHPDLPDALFPDDWPGVACRTLVHTLLDRFPRPDAARIAAL